MADFKGCAKRTDVAVGRRFRSCYDNRAGTVSRLVVDPTAGGWFYLDLDDGDTVLLNHRRVRRAR